MRFGNVRYKQFVKVMLVRSTAKFEGSLLDGAFKFRTPSPSNLDYDLMYFVKWSPKVIPLHRDLDTPLVWGEIETPAESEE